jgi:DNA-directed RNA polymerase subunit A'
MVTDENKYALEKLVKNGPKQYPGANYIIHPDGDMIDLDRVSDKSSSSLHL